MVNEETENNIEKDEAERAKIRKQIEENSVANFSYIFMNVMATIIASYGLLANSTSVIIGAMLIAALLGPITGIALGLVDGNNRLLTVSAKAEVYGVISVLVTAFIIGLIHSHLPTGSEIASRTSPNIMDLFIALAGGAAGAYATTKPKISAGLIGVAISTALVPPLATCAILVARGEFELGFGGFLLFFANFVAIQVTSSVVFWLSGYHGITANPKNENRKFLRNATVSVVVLAILTIVLGYNFYTMASEERFEQTVRKQLDDAIRDFPTTSISDVTFQSKNGKNVVTAILQTPTNVSRAQVANVEKNLPQNGSVPTELHVRSVITTETTRDGNIDPKTDNNVGED